jgi:hypothetical protein
MLESKGTHRIAGLKDSKEVRDIEVHLSQLIDAVYALEKYPGKISERFERVLSPEKADLYDDSCGSTIEQEVSSMCAEIRSLTRRVNTAIAGFDELMKRSEI